MHIVPQLDSSTYFSQLFWFSLLFFILYLSLNKIVVPKIEFWINKRSSYIKNNIDFANETVKFYEREMQSYENVIAKQNSQSSQLIDGLLKEEENNRLRAEHIASSQCQKIRDLANREIRTLRKNSQKELIDLSVEISSLYYSKLFNRELENKEEILEIAEMLYKQKFKKKVI